MPASTDSSLSTFSRRRTLSLPPRARSLLAARSRTTHPHSCLCRPEGRLQLADSMWRPTTSRARPHRPPSLHLKREVLWPKLPGPWGHTTSMHGQPGPRPEHWRFQITVAALSGHTALLRPRSLLADFLSLHFCFSEDEVRKDRYVTFIFIGHISDFHDISPIPSSEIIFVLKAQTFCTFTVGSCFDTMWINIKNETANRAGPDSVHRKPSLLLCAPSPNPRLPLTPGRVAEATPNLGGDSTDRPRPPKSPTEGHGGVCGQLSPPRRALALKN